MFSPDRITYSFIKTNDRLIIGLPWKTLFKEIFSTLYFKKHLSKHLYKPYQITICLTKNISLEVLNLLYFLSHKYSFFKLRQSEQQNVIIDIEQNFLLNSNLNSSKILFSDTCFLVGINPRYEGSQLNLRLKSRYLKGNFKIIHLSPLSNNTLATHNLSNNVNSLVSLVEGNNLFCQELINASNPILISNSELFKRKDSLSVGNALKLLVKYINRYSYFKKSKLINILNLTLNESGVNNLNNIKTLENLDFKNSQGIYFLNNSFTTSNVKKLLNLKLLNFFQQSETMSKLLITQNSILDTKKTEIFKKNFYIENQVHLPNNVFFEVSGSYINTYGKINKITKVVKSFSQTKSDWQIIRKFFSYCKKTFYIPNVFYNDKLMYNAKAPYYFKNYIGFQHYAISNLNNLAFQLFEKIKKPTLEFLMYKPKRNKFVSSPLRF
jgi:NADH dehydrogenase/NADH:ubiquinone oxidoreductase subunit G